MLPMNSYVPRQELVNGKGYIYAPACRRAGLHTGRQARLQGHACAKASAGKPAGPRIPIQGWTLRAQTHCQTKHRLMPCLGMLA
jgi:hypothetical protein